MNIEQALRARIETARDYVRRWPHATSLDDLEAAIRADERERVAVAIAQWDEWPQDAEREDVAAFVRGLPK
jgi:hypothetical protein